MTYLLYINDSIVDIGEDTSIVLKYESPLFGDLDGIQSNRSYTVELPRTETNEAIFDNAQRVDSATTLPYTRMTARLYIDGNVIFENGFAFLGEISDSFEITLVWGNINNFQGLFDYNLQELDITKDDLTYLPWTTETTLKSVAVGDVEPDWYKCDFGRGSDAEGAVRPSIGVQYILDKICESNGITLTGRSITDPDDNNADDAHLYIPLTEDNGNTELANKIGNLKLTYSESMPYASPTQWKTNGFPCSQLGTWDRYTYPSGDAASVIDTSGATSVTFTLNGGGTSDFSSSLSAPVIALESVSTVAPGTTAAVPEFPDYCIIYLLDQDGVEVGGFSGSKIGTVGSYSTSGSSHTTNYRYGQQYRFLGLTGYETSVTVDTRSIDSISIWIDNIGGGGDLYPLPGYNYTHGSLIPYSPSYLTQFSIPRMTVSFTGLTDSISPFEAWEIDDDGTLLPTGVALAANLPDMTHGDFLSELMAIRGYFAYADKDDDDAIFLFSADDIIANATPENALNWTDKLLLNSHKDVYSAESINYNAGDYAQVNTLDYDNDEESNMPNTIGKITTPLITADAEAEMFESEFSASVSIGGIATIPIFKPISSLEDDDDIDNDMESVNPRILALDTTTGCLAFPTSMSFSKIVNSRYSGLQQILNNPKSLVFNFKLTWDDVKAARFEVPIYLEQFDAYYALYSLETADDMICECELIRL